MVSYRLVVCDFYMCKPTPGHDVTYSEFRGSDIKQVPIIRIFGSSKDGEKACLHVHGVFPYIYVPYEGSEHPDKLKYELARGIDKAINISLGQASSSQQHIFKINLVSGIPFYGYHEKQHQYFKIYFYNPYMAKRATDMLQNGSIMSQVFQPHEAHTPYILQFMIDYNLQGMNMVNCEKVSHRQPSQTSEQEDATNDIVSSSDAPHCNTLNDTSPRATPTHNTDPLTGRDRPEKVSSCQVEVDLSAADILNRLEILSHSVVNPGLAALWEDEQQRRRLQGRSSQFTAPATQVRNHKSSVSEEFYRNRLGQKLLEMTMDDSISSQLRQDSPSSNKSSYPLETPDGENLLDASIVIFHTPGTGMSSSMETNENDNQETTLVEVNSDSDEVIESSQPSSPSMNTSHIMDSQDLELLDVLGKLATNKTLIEDVATNEEQDSILGSQPLDLEEDDVISLEMTQPVFISYESHISDDVPPELQRATVEGQFDEQDIPTPHTSMHCLSVLNSSFKPLSPQPNVQNEVGSKNVESNNSDSINESMLRDFLEDDTLWADISAEKIPQLDGADDPPIKPISKGKRFGIRGPVVSVCPPTGTTPPIVAPTSQENIQGSHSLSSNTNNLPPTETLLSPSLENVSLENNGTTNSSVYKSLEDHEKLNTPLSKSDFPVVFPSTSSSVISEISSSLPKVTSERQNDLPYLSEELVTGLCNALDWPLTSSIGELEIQSKMNDSYCSEIPEGNEALLLLEEEITSQFSMPVDIPPKHIEKVGKTCQQKKKSRLQQKKLSLSSKNRYDNQHTSAPYWQTSEPNCYRIPPREESSSLLLQPINESHPKPTSSSEPFLSGKPSVTICIENKPRTRKNTIKLVPERSGAFLDHCKGTWKESTAAKRASPDTSSPPLVKKRCLSLDMEIPIDKKSIIRVEIKPSRISSSSQNMKVSCSVEDWNAPIRKRKTKILENNPSTLVPCIKPCFIRLERLPSHMLPKLYTGTVSEKKTSEMEKVPLSSTESPICNTLSEPLSCEANESNNSETPHPCYNTKNLLKPKKSTLGQVRRRFKQIMKQKHTTVKEHQALETMTSKHDTVDKYAKSTQASTQYSTTSINQNIDINSTSNNQSSASEQCESEISKNIPSNTKGKKHQSLKLNTSKSNKFLPLEFSSNTSQSRNTQSTNLASLESKSSSKKIDQPTLITQETEVPAEHQESKKSVDPQSSSSSLSLTTLPKKSQKFDDRKKNVYHDQCSDHTLITSKEFPIPEITNSPTAIAEESLMKIQTRSRTRLRDMIKEPKKIDARMLNCIENKEISKELYPNSSNSTKMKETSPIRKSPQKQVSYSPLNICVTKSPTKSCELQSSITSKSITKDCIPETSEDDSLLPKNSISKVPCQQSRRKLSYYPSLNFNNKCSSNLEIDHTNQSLNTQNKNIEIILGSPESHESCETLKNLNVSLVPCRNNESQAQSTKNNSEIDMSKPEMQSAGLDNMDISPHLTAPSQFNEKVSHVCSFDNSYEEEKNTGILSFYNENNTQFDALLDSSQQVCQSPTLCEFEVMLEPAYNPPTKDEIYGSLREYDLLEQNFQDPYYSNAQDVQGKSKEVMGRKYQVLSLSARDLPAFNSTVVETTPFLLTLHQTFKNLIDIEPLVSAPKPKDIKKTFTEVSGKSKTMPIHSRLRVVMPNSPSCGDTSDTESLTLSPCSDPPSRPWTPISPVVTQQFKKRVPLIQSTPIVKPRSTTPHGKLDSQSDSCCRIDGPSPLNNTFGFRVALENLQEARAVVRPQHLTVLALELHVSSRAKLRPDPEIDPVCVIYYLVSSDDGKGSREIGVIAHLDAGDFSPLVSGSKQYKVIRVQSELEMINILLEVVQNWDPDILLGYEIEMSSWGYLVQRASRLEVNLVNRLSRVPKSERSWHQSGSHMTLGANSRFNMSQPSIVESGDDLKVTGRIILNLWKLMRAEIALQSYSFENLVYHVLHERVPQHSWQQLTHWWNHPSRRYRWMVSDYFLLRVDGCARLIDQLDLLGRTSELARVFGIQFYEVLSRGSQFRVESMMLRLAKPQNFVAVSPSIVQRSHMRAPECIPLVMEPESCYYKDPVIVLDFQSLYPSIIIAYNYCFSTCLGRTEHLGQEGPFQFGCTQLKVPAKQVQNLSQNMNISPCGVAFVNKETRLGILPRMLQEILNTRLMVKKSMKENKEDALLLRVLHARQLGLKLIANVTYGYTSANFSGRMPCIEVGDSVVSKGRETLERAIHMVENTKEWEARVVYGDTDSMFVLCPGKTRQQAFAIGAKIADAVTADNPSPVKLKLEKVYQPCILQTKKRYVGYMYESPDQEKPVYEAKGIETVRRDGCPAVAKILEKSLRILFETQDLSAIKQFVTRQCQKLLLGRLNMQDLVFAREFRGLSGYKPGACVPALELSRQWIRTDRRAEPRTGERVPYVVVSGAPGLPLIRLVRSPYELLEDASLRVNAEYYITRVIIPPLERCFSLLGVDVMKWYNDMPRRTISSMSNLPRQLNQKKGTISQYFSTVECVVCREQTKEGLCGSCQKSTKRTTLVLLEKLRKWERSSSHMAEVCSNCCGRTFEINCSSLVCPILFRRNQTEKDAEQGLNIRQLMDKYLSF